MRLPICVISEFLSCLFRLSGEDSCKAEKNNLRQSRVYLLLFLSLVLYSIRIEARTVANPVWLYSFDSHVDVTRIDYGTGKTTVHFVTCRHHETSFCIRRGIYVVGDDGVRRRAIGSKGIELDSVYFIGKGKGLSFSVDFDPVDRSNQALDVRNPSFFSIYGLHSADVSLAIPKARGEVPSEESDHSLFEPRGVTVEGILHDPSGKLGSTVEVNYIYHPNTEKHMKSQIDADGRFSIHFNMYAPQNTSFLYPYVHGNVGRLYLRPGDVVSVDLHDPWEGKGLSYRNLSGRKAYNNLSNAPGYSFDISEYYNNLRSNARFVNWSYQQQYDELMEGYDKNLEFADYVCWHYHLSPYETNLYLNDIHADFISLLLATDIAAKWQSVEERNMIPTEREKYKEIVNKMDYAYLKRLDPTDTSICTISMLTGIFGQIGQIQPIEDCFDQVSEGESDRWQKIIALQQKELNRITGWEGMTFIMEQIIVQDISTLKVKKIDVKKELQQVKQMLKHPYNQVAFDKYCAYYLENRQ